MGDSLLLGTLIKAFVIALHTLGSFPLQVWNGIFFFFFTDFLLDLDLKQRKKLQKINKSKKGPFHTCIENKH